MEKYPFEITEKRTIKRITLRQSLTDFLDAFNIERGLIYTVKLLMLSPGRLVREYLGVKRYAIVNPFRLLVLTTAISLLLMSVSDLTEVFREAQQGENANLSQGDFGRFFFEWYNLMLWIAIPIFALMSFWFNKGESYNYTEHLVLQSFCFSMQNLFYVLFNPLNLAFDIGTAMLMMFVIGSVYYLYFFSSFFQKPGIGFIGKNLVSYLLAYLLYFSTLGVITFLLLRS